MSTTTLAPMLVGRERVIPDELNVNCSLLFSSAIHRQQVSGSSVDPAYSQLIANCGDILNQSEFVELNDTEHFDASPYNLEQKIFIGLLLGSMILLAILGNVLVCVAVLTDRYLKKINNLFYVSLAIADLLMAVLVMTPALVNDILGYWVFDNKFCYIWISFDVMCSTLSILNLCAISLDRYIHIRNPLRYDQLMTLSRILLMIGGVWVTSLLISLLPINLGWHTPPNENFSMEVLPLQNGTNLPVCILTFNPIFAVLSSLVSFYIPCIVMLIIYFRLFAFASRHAKEIRKMQTFERFSPGVGTNNNGKKSKSKGSKLSDNKAAFTLGIIMGVFLLCWVPFFIVNIIGAFCEECIPPIIFATLTWLGYLNSCMNPVIYSIFNAEFRRAFKKILCSNRMCNIDTKTRIFCFKEIKKKSVEFRTATPRISRKMSQVKNGHNNGTSNIYLSALDDSTLPLHSNGSSEKITSV